MSDPADNVGPPADAAVLAHMVEQLEEGVILYDRTGAVTYANRVARDVLGDRFQGRTGLPLLVDDVTIGDRTGSAQTPPAEKVQRVLETGRGAAGRVVGVTTGDGHHLWLQVATSPVRDGTGAVVGAMSTFFDVTEREGTLLVLAASEARWRGVVDALCDALVCVGPDGVIDAVNPAAAALFGVDVLGLDVHQGRWPTRRLDGTEMPLDEFPERVALREQRYAEALFARVLPDGTEQWLHTSAAPRGDGGVVALARDVTDLVRFQREATAGEQRFAHAVENLDHELGLYRPVVDSHGRVVDLQVEYLNPTGVARRRKEPGDLASEVFAEPESALAAAQEALERGVAEPYRFGDDRAEPPRVYEVRTSRVGGLVMMVCLDRTIGEDPLELYRLTFDSLTDALHLSAPVLDDGQLVDIEYVFANRAAQLLHPPGDHVGRRASDVFPDWEDVRPLFRAAWEHPGEVCSSVVDNLDGSEPDLPSYCILLRVRRLGDLLLSVGVDITAEQRARRDLAVSEERYRSVVDTLSEGVIVVGGDGVVQAVNPAVIHILGSGLEMVGQQASQWDFRAWDEDGNLLTGETLPGVVAVRTQQAAEQLMWRHLRGRHQWLHVRAVPVDPARRGPVVVAFRDVTEEQELTRSLAQSEERHRTTLTRLPDPVLELEPVHADGDIVGLDVTYANPAAAGFDPEELAERLVPAARRVWGGGDETCRMDDAGRRWQVKVARAGDAIVAVARDTTEQDEAAEATEWAAAVDANTGLASRARLERHICERLDRGGGGSVAVLLVRMSGLDRTRIDFGFELADRAVAGTSERLVAWADKGDLLTARVSETSFAVVVESVTSVRDAVGWAEDLARALEAGGAGDVVAVSTPVSVGVAVAPLHGESAEAVLRRAEAAAFFAAQEGGRVRVWQPGLHKPGQERAALVARLGEALAGGEIYLEYHPRYDLRDGAFLGFEAQAVWQHPGRGRLSERVFLPQLAGSRAMDDYTRWVIATATAETASVLEGPARVGVGLPAATATDAGFAGLVTDGLLDAGLPGGVLAVEFAERGGGVVFPTVDQIAAVRGLGVAARLDDFGVGTSGLATVARGGIDGVNLDRSLARDVVSDRLDQRIVAACVDVAHAAGLTVCATGVETEAARDRLAELGCDGAQGFWFSRPVSAGAIAHGWRPSPPS